jgi:hypothetical protein
MPSQIKTTWEALFMRMATQARLIRAGFDSAARRKAMVFLAALPSVGRDRTNLRQPLGFSR